MPIKKVLITVTTYPLPSRSYDELVCTAGVLEDGSWIRIYPVPLSFILDQKTKALREGVKYTWIELELQKRLDDFRPESHSPKHYDFRDVKFHEPRLDTKGNLIKRKEFCLRNVYTNLSKLIADSKAPKNVSLATFKPTKITGFEWEEDDREWKDEWVEIRKQQELFSEGKVDPQKMIPKVPYKFFYKFVDDAGKQSRMMIEDWEIGSLYWNCLKGCDSENIALQKVSQRYYNDFVSHKDLYFFLRTTKTGHIRRFTNPFVIIGVFYPKKEIQGSLF